MKKQIVFGVDILQHLKKQLTERKLEDKEKADLENLIKHVEDGKDYHEYKRSG